MILFLAGIQRCTGNSYGPFLGPSLGFSKMSIFSQVPRVEGPVLVPPDFNLLDGPELSGEFGFEFVRPASLEGVVEDTVELDLLGSHVLVVVQNDVDIGVRTGTLAISRLDQDLVVGVVCVRLAIIRHVADEITCLVWECAKSGVVQVDFVRVFSVSC